MTILFVKSQSLRDYERKKKEAEECGNVLLGECDVIYEQKVFWVACFARDVLILDTKGVTNLGEFSSCGFVAKVKKGDMLLARLAESLVLDNQSLENKNIELQSLNNEMDETLTNIILAVNGELDDRNEY